MIIRGNIQALAGAYNVSSAANTHSIYKTSAVKKSDELVLSGEAKSFSAMLNKLQAIDETRTSRVEELKNEVNSGNYNVDSDKIALSLLNARY